MVQGIATSFWKASNTPFPAALRTGTAASAAATGDTVSFSDEAVAKSRESAPDGAIPSQATADGDKSPWETRYGLKAGTVFLKNGHSQVTSLHGSKMEILEYDGTRLARRETGSIAAGGVVKDIEEYDKRGELTRRVHSELAASDAAGTTSHAYLRRDIAWYKDGEVSKELHDSMSVKASYASSDIVNGKDVSDAQSLDELAGTLTRDDLTSDYVGDILEYGGAGRLFRKTSIAHAVSTESRTNRGSEKRNGIEAHGTVEVSRQTEFSITQEMYDDAGNVSFQASFRDSLKEGTFEQQEFEARWYDNGQLVRHSSAEILQKQAKGRGLGVHPDMLGTLSLSEGQYGATTPLDAQALLGDGQGGRVAETGSLLGAALTSIAAGGYDPAQAFARDRAEVPGSVRWEDTLYKDGKVALRKVDTETVEENTLPDTTGFHTLTGLSEDKDPKYLRSTSHSVETYQEGRLVAQSAVEMRESAEDDARGVTSTKTHVDASFGSGHTVRNTHAKLSETLVEADARWDAAAQKAGSAMQTTLEDLLTLFQENLDPAETTGTSDQAWRGRRATPSADDNSTAF
ncbi:MAG TPA: hypothetical protein PKD41_05815 [Solidesulfovibrio sp.]|nr:hypothetical protein [Desulfovibrio sp.]HML60386.1 hypothetical protein [Solidesulfovibrio sp.]